MRTMRGTITTSAGRMSASAAAGMLDLAGPDAALTELVELSHQVVAALGCYTAVCAQAWREAGELALLRQDPAGPAAVERAQAHVARLGGGTYQTDLDLIRLLAGMRAHRTMPGHVLRECERAQYALERARAGA